MKKLFIRVALVVLFGSVKYGAFGSPPPLPKIPDPINYYGNPQSFSTVDGEWSYIDSEQRIQFIRLGQVGMHGETDAGEMKMLLAPDITYVERLRLSIGADGEVSKLSLGDHIDQNSLETPGWSYHLSSERDFSGAGSHPAPFEEGIWSSFFDESGYVAFDFSEAIYGWAKISFARGDLDTTGSHDKEKIVMTVHEMSWSFDSSLRVGQISSIQVIPEPSSLALLSLSLLFIKFLRTRIVK